MKRRSMFGLPLVLLVLAACGDSDGAGNDGDLTPAEAQDLIQVLARMSSVDPGDDVWSCPEGGNARETGTVGGDEQARTYTFLVVLQGCRGSSEDGTSFILYGNLSVTADVELDERGRVLSLDGSHEGTLGWRAGDRSGHCPMVLSTSGSSTGPGASFSLTGTLCGNTVSHTLPMR